MSVLGEMLVKVMGDDSQFAQMLKEDEKHLTSLSTAAVKTGQQIAEAFTTGAKQVAAWGSAVGDSTKYLDKMKERQGEILKQIEAIKTTGAMTTPGGIVTGKQLSEAQQAVVVAGLEKEYKTLDATIKEVSSTVTTYSNAIDALRAKEKALSDQYTNLVASGMKPTSKEAKELASSINEVRNQITYVTNTSKVYTSEVEKLRARHEELKKQLTDLTTNALSATGKGLDQINKQISATQQEYNALDQKLKEVDVTLMSHTNILEAMKTKQANVRAEILRLTSEGLPQNQAQLQTLRKNMMI